MPSISCLRTATRVALLSTTALVALPTMAFAVDRIIDDPLTETVYLGAGTNDSLLLKSDNGSEAIGSISSTSPGVAVIDVANSITINSGSYIADTEIGIEIEGVGADLTGGILNDGVISGVDEDTDLDLTSGYGIRVKTGADISGGVENNGELVGENAAIVLSGTFVLGVSTPEGTSGGYYSGGSISGGIVNTGYIAGEDFGGIVAYNGGSISGGILNEEEAEIGGQYVGIGVLAGANIAGSTNGEIAGIDNAGLIEGGYVGIAVIGASPDIITTEESFGLNSSHLDNPNRFGADISGGINNTGTIIGEYVAIGTAIDGDISGGIVNGQSGLIGLMVDATHCGTDYFRSEVGIASLGNSDISGEIVNSGVIFGDLAGIATSAGGDISGGIVNEASGRIGFAVAGSGYSGDPIRSEIGIGAAYFGAISGGISNSGAIYGDEAAIGAAAGSMIGGITNNYGGTIGEAGEGASATSENGIAIVEGSVVSSTASVPTLTDLIEVISVTTSPLSDVAVGISNSGVIIGNSAAIFVRGENSDIAGALINETTGVIGRNSAGTVTAEMGIEVDGSGAISGGIINRGTIFGDTTAIQVDTNASIAGINNSGYIGLSVIEVQGIMPEPAFMQVSDYGIRVTQGSVISSLSTDGISEPGPFSEEIGTALLNSGTIVGEDSAIYVSGVGSDISGTIVNEAAGVIGGYLGSSSDQNYGINVQNGGAITGGIINSGVIFGEDASIYANSGAVIGGIVNKAGGIIGLYEDGEYEDEYETNVGIYVGASALVSTTASAVTTFGPVSAFANATAAVVATGITNSGFITGADYGIHIAAGGAVGAATGVGISNLAGGVIGGGSAGVRIQGALNGGLSNAGGIYSDDFAIHVSGDAEISGDIVNWGGGVIAGEDVAINIGGEASIETNIINHVGGIIVSDTFFVSSSDLQAGIALRSQSSLTGNIVNSGLIGGEDAAVAVVENSLITGSLINKAETIEDEDYYGRLLGEDYGVYVAGGSEITGAIQNAGSVLATSGTGIAIVNSASVGSIDNSGRIWGEDGGHGVAIAGGAKVTGNVINSGAIWGSSEGDGFAIYEGGSILGNITNSGSIWGSYDGNGLSVTNGGSIIGNVTNSGYIGAEDVGVYLATSGSIASLQNEVGGNILGEDYGVYVGEGGSFTNTTDSINNAGLISAASGTGIFAAPDADIRAITNSGTITGGNGQAIQFDNKDSTLTLQTGSELNGNAHGGTGTNDTLILEGYGTEDATFTEFEALIVNADTDGIWTLSDETTEIGGGVTVNSGTLLITGDLIATSAMAAEGADLDVEGVLDLGTGELIVNGIVDGSGTIKGTVFINGILSPGNSPGKLTFVGPITETTGSVYIVEHDANFVGPYQTDLTEVTVGSATIEPGVTVQLEVAAGSDGFADDILTAVGGVIGTYDELVIAEDNIVALIVYPDANTVAIVAGKTDALAASVGTVSDAGFVFLDNLQEGARREGRIWATGYIYNAENEGLGQNGADFDQDAFGFNAGVDVISQPNLKVGLALGYLDGDIDIDSGTSEAENDALFGAAYLNYMSDNFYLDGTLMIGQQSIDTTRTLTVGTAKASTDATSYGANLEVGLELAALGGRLSPFVKVGIHSASLDSYSESGAVGAMTVGEVDTQQMRVSGGFRYAIDLGSEDGIQVTPALKLGLTQEWHDGDSSADIGFVGYTGSTTASLDFEDQTTIDLGLSFDVKLSQAVTAFVGWDAALGDETTRNTGTIGLSVNW